jgi:Arc/MetJ family transcription regulator
MNVYNVKEKSTCIRPCVARPYSFASWGQPMRNNIVIEDKLMEEALQVTGLKTKREVVELGLRTLIRLKKQEEIRKLRGKLKWEGDLEEMRSS